MATNLIDMAKSYLTDSVISRVSNTLGESPEGTQKALTGAIPIFLGSLISRGSSPDGANFVGTLLQRFTPTASASPETPVDANDPEVMMQRGQGLVDSLFGPGSSMVSGALAKYAGVDSSSASGLLGMAGSLITGALSQQVMSPDGRFDPGSLVNVLASQKDTVMAALPTGLAALMGNIPSMDALGNLGGKLGGGVSALSGGLGSMMGRKADETPAPAPTPVPAPAPVGGRVDAPVNTPAYSEEKSGGFNVLPWLLALAAAALIYFAVRGCGDKNAEAITTPTNDTTSASIQDATATVDTVQADMSAAADTARTAIAAAADQTAEALGAFGAKKLPDGVELNIPANGIESKLIAFIEDSSKPVDKTTWFNFDRLLYETASAKLKPESREQLQNIAAILKAYPTVNLKIGGYTDNTGKAEANKKLSQQRAESAMNELVSLGVSASRLEAEGYGIENPVASNDTAAGRAQNRRTACRVTKK